jgi:RNA-directed DNA polymerase
VYLDALDHFVKESLHCRAYVRYVDDFLLCSDDRRTLREWKTRLGVFLAGLRLRLHPAKCEVFPASQGTGFLGFRVFPRHWRLRARLFNEYRYSAKIRRAMGR